MGATAVLTACPGPLSFLCDGGEVEMKSETFHLRHSQCVQLEDLASFELASLSSTRRQSSDSWPFFFFFSDLLSFEQILFSSAPQLPQVLDSGRRMMPERRSGHPYCLYSLGLGMGMFSKYNKQFASQTPEDQALTIPLS